jgi:hypothetical protein
MYNLPCFERLLGSRCLAYTKSGVRTTTLGRNDLHDTTTALNNALPMARRHQGIAHATGRTWEIDKLIVHFAYALLSCYANVYSGHCTWCYVRSIYGLSQRYP